MLINGQAYDWASLRFSFLGNFNAGGVTAVSYGYEQDKANAYGAGSDPYERTKGQIRPVASISMTVKELRNLIAAAGNQPLHKVPAFSLTVSYQNGVDPVTTDTILFAEFTNAVIEMARGDQDTEVELPLVVGGIRYNQ